MTVLARTSSNLLNLTQPVLSEQWQFVVGHKESPLLAAAT
jgi:hypothetical protein